jgi:hypothetical protein
MSSETEIPAVTFGHHVPPILTLGTFFFWRCLKDIIHNSNPRTKELNENIRREIANIPEEQLRRVDQIPSVCARNVCV